jgi:acyl-coenzyme A synthetase/AMP-(fatty) acid ligase
VAVYMTNSAEAYFTAMALSKLGVTNAMINSSLKGLSQGGC